MHNFKSRLKIIIKKLIPKRYLFKFVQVCSFIRYYSPVIFIVNICKYRNFSFNPNVKVYWNSVLSKFNDFWRDENYYHILDLLPRNCAFLLLDIGCAIGDGCELLHTKFPKAKITGVDISDIGIKKAITKAATKSMSIDYFVLDVLQDPLPDIYDYITVIETLEHFDNPFFVIEKCLRHVRKSVIISTPYTPSYTKKICAGEHRYVFNEHTFSNRPYNSRVVRVTGYVKSTRSKCIIYEIFP